MPTTPTTASDLVATPTPNLSTLPQSSAALDARGTGTTIGSAPTSTAHEAERASSAPINPQRTGRAVDAATVHAIALIIRAAIRVGDVWVGTSSQLLIIVRQAAPPETIGACVGTLKSPEALGRALQRWGPSLCECGVQISRRRGPSPLRARRIVLRVSATHAEVTWTGREAEEVPGSSR